MKKFKIKIFADGANLDSIIRDNKKKFISGFTTNPSLMAKAKIGDYKKFGYKICQKVRKKHLSFEVISDNHQDIIKEAKIISNFGKNAFVKIPIVNSKGKSNLKAIASCCELGINLNITAVFTFEQVVSIFSSTKKNKSKIIISIFAGRIADTGKDPCHIISKAIKLVKTQKRYEVLWASTREVFNIYQAEKLGCHIITVTSDVLNKLKLYNKDLLKYSIETSKSFFDDAKKSKISLL